MNEDKCDCKSEEIFVFPCSGGSNVGQIANEAGKDFSRLKCGKMFCLAGIGGHVSDIIESTKLAKKIIAIDGCQLHCAKKTLEYAGLKPDVHIVVTDLGIQKNYDFIMDNSEIDKVIEKIKEELI